MSTASQQPEENQEGAKPTGHNGTGRPNLPARRDGPPPANREELSEEKRQRLEQLAEWANAAHDLAEDAALRFCRHSVQAGMALLEAQDLCPKEIWSAWLADHFDWSARTAQRYMRQAKIVLLMGGKTTDLSFLPPEELARLLEQGLKRIERQRVAALTQSEAATSATREEDAAVLEVSDNSPPPPPPSASGDPLATTLGLFDELLAALERAIESGQWLDYGPYVLNELQRIRGDLDACRLLVCDSCSSTAALA
ncbi:MAG TPA: hypothetical protein VNH11_14790 [Pirellulales bacterium]|nr:hypothetical protein [Pirellulales bacterium]